MPLKPFMTRRGPVTGLGRSIPLTAILLLAFAGLLRAQLIDINFTQNSSSGTGGPNPGPTMTGAALLGSAGDHWNGINGSSGSGTALVKSDGTASPVTVSFTSGGGYNVYNYGGTTPFSGTPYNKLMETYLYNDGVPQTITLSGLDPNACYEVALYDAADANGTGRVSYYTIGGNTLSCTWNGTASNLVQGVDCALFPLALSSNTGTLTITYTGNGTTEGDINGLQIQKAPVMIGAAYTGTNAMISFMTQNGFSYQLLYENSLASNEWINLGSPVAGNGTVQSAMDIPVGTSRFYRVAIITNAVSLPLLHAGGTSIANASGNVVLLKGLNLGGWFIMEPWMCPADSGGLPDTYSIISELDQRFGVVTEQGLIRTYQTNWITTADLDNLKNEGFNCVRMPVWWGNFYPINNTTSSGWRSDAFTVLDWLVTNCAARGIYVVIDMHGVIGGQGTSDDTGQQNQNTFWTNSVQQAETAYMWSQIASHYRSNSAVAGYDLINEPDGVSTPSIVWNVYSNLYDTIRAVDPTHMIIMEGTFGNWNWSMLPNPSTFGWTNIVYSMHEYKFGGSVAQIEAGSDSQVTDFNNHKSWNVPDYIGEWNDMGQGAACYDYSINDYTTNGMSWCMWAYKATSGLVPNGWGWYDPTYWPTTPNVSTDSAATISNDWQQWRTTVSFGVNSTVGL
jgi:endoglucanase